MLLGSCSANSTSCVVTTQSITTKATLKHNLDMCTVEGVRSGNRVNGVAASSALAAGRCYVDSDCSTDGRWKCSDTSNLNITTCNDGVDTAVSQGICQLSPSAVCSDCLLATQSFAVQNLLATDASGLTTAWRSYCSSNKLAASEQCEKLAAAIKQSTTAGKRSAFMCMTIRQCSKDLVDTVSVAVNGVKTLVEASALDLCTIEGAATGSNGTLPPGISANTNVPDGYCRSSADCDKPTDNCDASKTTSVSSCGIDGGLKVTDFGTCVPNNTAEACSQCNSCLDSLQSYVASVKSEMDANKVASTWQTTCTGLTTSATGFNVTSATCSSITDRIKSDRRFGKRAASLCIAMKACNPTVSCTFVAGTLKSTALDTCTSEVGLEGRIVGYESTTS